MSVVDTIRLLQRAHANWAWNYLEVVKGPHDGYGCPLNEGKVTIGRSSANDLCLGRDPTVSGEHAMIRQREGVWMLEDLGSSNGSFVDDKRVISRVEVRVGTRIRLGDTELIVREPGSAFVMW